MADTEGSDEGVDQATRSAMRAAVMAAAVAAEQVVRHMRGRREQDRLESIRRGEQLTQRYAAERQLARTALAGADERWVRGADVDEVAQLVATAKAWADLEPAEFGPRLEELREQITQTRDDAEAVLSRTPGAAATPSPEADRVVDAVDRAGAGAVTAGVAADAAADVTEARAAGCGAAEERPAYDSADRRTELYRRAVEAGADEEVAAGRVLAATAEASPLVDALARAAAGPVSGAAAAPGRVVREQATSRLRQSGVGR